MMGLTFDDSVVAAAVEEDASRCVVTTVHGVALHSTRGQHGRRGGTAREKKSTSTIKKLHDTRQNKT